MTIMKKFHVMIGSTEANRSRLLTFDFFGSKDSAIARASVEFLLGFGRA